MIEEGRHGDLPLRGFRTTRRGEPPCSPFLFLFALFNPCSPRFLRAAGQQQTNVVLEATVRPDAHGLD